MCADILVLGAINIDVTLVPSTPLVRQDSNLVEASIAIGGVGANVARNLAFLGHRVRMITTMGHTAFHAMAEADLRRHGVELSDVIHLDDVAPNFYINLLDPDGELHYGLNDMRAVATLSPDVLATKSKRLMQTSVLVLDNNIPPATLHYALTQTSASIRGLDLVSAAKAPQALEVLPHLTLLKANRIEFETLCDTGFDPATMPDLTVIVTDGPNPITIHQGTTTRQITPPPIATVVDVSGAGDALFAGVIDALTSDKPIAHAVTHGILLAQRVLRRRESILKEDQA
jgi:pseudouridine kinase